MSAHAQPSLQSQRSVPEVLQDIVGNLQELIRSEFQLATTEIKEDASRAAKPAAIFGAGLVLGMYALGFMLLAVVYALSTLVAAWLAALIVAAAVALVAIVCVNIGQKGLKHSKVRPDKTVQSMKENVQWAKDQIR